MHPIAGANVSSLYQKPPPGIEPGSPLYKSGASPLNALRARAGFPRIRGSTGAARALLCFIVFPEGIDSGRDFHPPSAKVRRPERLNCWDGIPESARASPCGQSRMPQNYKAFVRGWALLAPAPKDGAALAKDGSVVMTCFLQWHANAIFAAPKNVLHADSIASHTSYTRHSSASGWRLQKLSQCVACAKGRVVASL